MSWFFLCKTGFLKNVSHLSMCHFLHSILLRRHFAYLKKGHFLANKKQVKSRRIVGIKKKTLAVSKRGKKNQLTVRRNSFSRRAFFYFFIFCSAASAEVTLRLIQQQPRTREHQQREGKEERERCLLAIAIIVSLLSRCWWKCWSNRRR